MRCLATVSVLSFALLTLPARGQTTLGIGDPAPKLEIASWVKGRPVDLAAGKGKNVYVLEFWATWCPPCIQSLPHLGEIQKHYKDKNVVVVAISDEPQSVISQFVGRMGDKLDYTVACDDQQKTNSAYMLASGQTGIPTTFIIDQQGRVAWIGSPFSMDRVLEEIVTGKYDLAKAKSQAEADEKFFRVQYVELGRAIQSANWEKCIEIGRSLADPMNSMSRMLRSQVLHSIAWSLLADERAEKKYFKEALHLAKTAYEHCGCDDPSIIDTYARALYDNGQVKEAVEYQRQAVSRADGMMKRELEQSLKEYESKAKAGS